MDRLLFDVLSFYAGDRDLDLQAEIFGYSDAELNHAKEVLGKETMIADEAITEKGLQALEPYRVKKAIFLAAGFGSRMVPITINTPKPMVKVHNQRIIETLIDAVIQAGINEIYIVRGYLGDQFDLLKKKYPQILFIDNPEYNGTGTISSFYYAKDLLENAYVLESDLVVVNPHIIHKYHYSSDFMGTKVESTDDWYFRTLSNGAINEIGVCGAGKNLFKLIGISYWSRDDGKRLSHDIQEAYEGIDGKKLPMSYVPFRVYRDKYSVSIMPCKANDVIEIDSFAELQAYDEAYAVK